MKETERKYCPKCEKNVEASIDKPHHWANGLASVVTGGLWLPVWGAIAYKKKGNPYVCPSCLGDCTDYRPQK